MIYFITDGKSIKIGKSKDPLKRLRRLQTGNASPLSITAIFNLPDKWERRIHKLCKFDRDGGEWFTLSEEKLTWLIGYLRDEECKCSS